MREQHVMSGHKSARLGLSVLAAGVGGGLAEILWVAVYGAFIPVSGLEIAREVTASLFPTMAGDSASAWLGIAIHMTLAVALGYGFAYAIWKPLVRVRGPLATLSASALTLAMVWGMNFLVILPALNPAFVALMPNVATFASKMLFATVMGGLLASASGDASAPARPFRVPVLPRAEIK